MAAYSANQWILWKQTAPGLDIVTVQQNVVHVIPFPLGKKSLIGKPRVAVSFTDENYSNNFR